MLSTHIHTHTWLETKGALRPSYARAHISMQSAPSKMYSEDSVGAAQNTSGGANGKSSGKEMRSLSGIRSSAASESVARSLWSGDSSSNAQSNIEISHCCRLSLSSFTSMPEAPAQIARSSFINLVAAGTPAFLAAAKPRWTDAISASAAAAASSSPLSSASSTTGALEELAAAASILCCMQTG